MKLSAIIADGTFTCTTAPLQGPYESVLEQAAKIGYDAVQLTVNRPEEVDVERVNDLCRKHGLFVSAIATGMGYTVDGFSMGSGDEENRRGAVARMCGHVDLAVKLGGAMVIIGAIRGRYADAPCEEVFYDQFHKSVREIVEYAQEKNIVVILEANDHLETEAYITTEGTAQYIRSLNSPSLRLQLDTMHMLYENEAIGPAILPNGDILAQVDISGNARSCPVPGAYDYPQVIRCLKQIGFEGVLAFEFCPAPPENAAQVGYDYIRGLIDEK